MSGDTFAGELTREGIAMRLTVRARQTRPGVITVTPQGRIDGETHGVLDQELGRMLEEPVKVVVLDMHGVDFITSAGIGTIMKARASLATKGAELALMNMQPQVRKVVEIIRVLPTLGVFQDDRELDDYLGTIQRRMTGEEDD